MANYRSFSNRYSVKIKNLTTGEIVRFSAVGSVDLTVNIPEQMTVRTDVGTFTSFIGRKEPERMRIEIDGTIYGPAKVELPGKKPRKHRRK